MTDQGALERARALRVLKRLSGNPRTMIPMQFADDEVVVIAAAITTAEAEARAAALLDYASKLEALGEIKPSTLTVDAAVRGIITDLRALATPAQSEGK